MALCLTLAATVIVFDIIKSTEANGTLTNTGLNDPQHRKELVNEAFLEQKDVLLDMLEAKLKEVRDKKKKKASEKVENNTNNGGNKCDTQPKGQKLALKANGISNVGVVNLLMSHGLSGKGQLKLDADGISNVGRAHLDVEMEGGVNVPGIGNSLIAEPPRLNNLLCENQEKETTKDIQDTTVSIPDVEQHIEAGGLDERSLRKADIVNTVAEVNKTKVNDTKLFDDVEKSTAVTASTDKTTPIAGDVSSTSTVTGSTVTTHSSNLNTVA